jgi:hypothetical protein
VYISPRFSFLKLAKNLLPYINIGEVNKGVAESKRKENKTGGNTKPPLRRPHERLA